MSNGKASVFWYGGRMADCDTFDESAEWAHGESSAIRIRLLNLAFQIYHKARWKIDACEERERHQKMIRELEDAATSGWGRGVTDLEEAFEHLIENNAWIGGGGSWTDNTTTFLSWDPHGTCVAETGNCMDKVPASAANFLMAVDKRLKRVRECAEGHAIEAGNAQQAYDKQDWDWFEHSVEQVVQYGKTAEYLLWWVPKIHHYLHGPLAFFEVLNACCLYTDARAAGLNTTSSAALSAAYTALSFGLPGIGFFYAEMIRGVPGLIRGVRQEMQDYYDRIDKEAGIR
jgi:hypothetical protein